MLDKPSNYACNETTEVKYYVGAFISVLFGFPYLNIRNYNFDSLNRANKTLKNHFANVN